MANRKEDIQQQNAGAGRRRDAERRGHGIPDDMWDADALPDNRAADGKAANEADGITAGDENAGEETALPKVENVPASDKPKGKLSIVRKSRVVLENDEKAFKKRFLPGNIRTWIIEAICLAVLVWSAWTLIDYLQETGGAEAQFDEVIEEYIEPEPVPVEQQDPDTSAWPPIVDFAALQADNPDVAGWIRIPGTSVDYPVMTNSENDYYLHRDMNGNYSMPGAIFADYQNTNDLSQNHIVIYGHHMVTPTMFHDVANYSNKDFFEKHRVIYLETPETTYVLRPIAMYEVEPTEYDTRKVLFDNTQSFQEYFDERLARSDYITFDDYKRSTADRLVTLITCNDTGRKRQVVECVVDQEYPTSMIPQVIARALEDANNGVNVPDSGTEDSAGE